MSNPLTPSDYANQWCDTIIGEKEECKRGVDFATKALTSQSAPDVINQCTSFYGTEGYRTGCYLTVAFNGPSENLCTTQFNDTQGHPTSFSFPCAKSCITAFGSQGQADTCSTSAQSMFNQLVQDNGTCGAPSFSCVDGLDQSGLPWVVGCTLGGLESQFLNQVQQYQQSQSQTPLSCTNFLYSNQTGGGGGGGGGSSNGGGGGSSNGGGGGSSNGGGGGSSNGGGGGDNSPQNWNPWPEGPTYGPNDGNF